MDCEILVANELGGCMLWVAGSQKGNSGVHNNVVATREFGAAVENALHSNTWLERALALGADVRYRSVVRST